MKVISNGVIRSKAGRKESKT